MRDDSADALLPAARQILDDALAALDESIAGLDAHALNWRPAPDANSIAVLAVHALHSTRSWLTIATGAPLPARDRPAEFRTSADTTAAFRSSTATIARDCRELLRAPQSVDWSAMRRTHARPDTGEPEEVPAAWALMHALEHLREHVGQMALTRELWMVRAM